MGLSRPRSVVGRFAVDEETLGSIPRAGIRVTNEFGFGQSVAVRSAEPHFCLSSALQAVPD